MKHKSLTQWNRKPAKYNVIYCFSTQFCQIHNSNGHPTGINRALLFFSPFSRNSIVTNDASYGYLCAQQMLQHIMPRHEKQRRMKRKKNEHRVDFQHAIIEICLLIAITHSIWRYVCIIRCDYVRVHVHGLSTILLLWFFMLWTCLYFAAFCYRQFFFVLVLLLRLVCFKILVVLSTNWHLFSVLLHVLDTYAIFRIEFCIQLIAIGNFLNYIYDWELFSANYFQWIMQFSNQLYGFFSSFFIFSWQLLQKAKNQLNLNGIPSNKILYLEASFGDMLWQNCQVCNIFDLKFP